MLTTEFDSISEDIRIEVNKAECNFARATVDNMTRVLHILATTSIGDRVQIAQLEIGIQLNLSQNRVSELLKLAKKNGLIAIDMICRCGDIRNEYTLLDNPIINTIKRIVFKSSQADPRENIELAISNTMAFYKLQGIEAHILEEVKRRIPINEFKKANGILKYFQKTLRTVNKELSEPADSNTYNPKNKKGSFTDYPQRKYDFDELEKQLSGTKQIDRVAEGESFDIKSELDKFRKWLNLIKIELRRVDPVRSLSHFSGMLI